MMVKRILAVMISVLVLSSCLVVSAESVTLVDENTGVTAVVEEGRVRFSVETAELEDGTKGKIFCIYLMSLSGDYENDTLDVDVYAGKAKITIPYEYDNCQVFGTKAEDGGLAEIKATYANGAYTFTVDQWNVFDARFIIRAAKTLPTNSDVKGDNPKTGSSDLLIPAAVLMVACAAAVCVCGKKK